MRVSHVSNISLTRMWVNTCCTDSGCTHTSLPGEWKGKEPVWVNLLSFCGTEWNKTDPVRSARQRQELSQAGSEKASSGIPLLNSLKSAKLCWKLLCGNRFSSVAADTFFFGRSRLPGPGSLWLQTGAGRVPPGHAATRAGQSIISSRAAIRTEPMGLLQLLHARADFTSCLVPPSLCTFLFNRSHLC